MHAVGELALEPGQERPTDDQDRRLVLATLAGDHAAFDRLVQRHWSRVASVAGRFLDDPNEVDDAAQEAFVQAYRHLRGFRGEASVRTWLIRIVANVCRSRRRSAWRRQVELTEEPEELQGALPDDRQALDTALSAHEVGAAVDRLPDRLRLPLVLYFYEELSGPEIAAALGWNESTVWTRIYAAYRELRKQLGPLQDR